MMVRNLVFLLSVVVLGTACSDDEICDNLPGLEKRDECDGPSDQMGMTALDLMNLYVVENDLENVITKRPDNLWYVVHEEGGHEKPNITSRVRVAYVGYFRNGCKFDSSSDVSFNLSGLIDAWRIAIPLLGDCGSITIIAPPRHAYGSNPPPGIPEGEPLIFDIQLLDF